MSLILKLKVGQMVIEVDAETPQGIIQQGAFWSQVAAKCEGRPNVGFFCRNTKKGQYFGVVDPKDGAELTFHQYKPESGGGFYVTDEDSFKIWQRGDTGAQPDAPADCDQGDPGNPDPEPEPERPPARAAAAPAAPASRDYTMRGPAPARQPSQAPPRPPQTAWTQTGNQKWR